MLREHQQEKRLCNGPSVLKSQLSALRQIPKSGYFTARETSRLSAHALAFRTGPVRSPYAEQSAPDLRTQGDGARNTVYAECHHRRSGEQACGSACEQRARSVQQDRGCQQIRQGAETEGQHQDRSIDRAAAQQGSEQNRIDKSAGQPAPEHSERKRFRDGIRRQEPTS